MLVVVQELVGFDVFFDDRVKDSFGRHVIDKAKIVQGRADFYSSLVVKVIHVPIHFVEELFMIVFEIEGSSFLPEVDYRTDLILGVFLCRVPKNMLQESHVVQIVSRTSSDKVESHFLHEIEVVAIQFRFDLLEEGFDSFFIWAFGR